MMALRVPGVYRLYTCIKAAPPYIRSRKKWIARRFFERWYMWPCVVEHQSGAKYKLGKDRLDDQILMDLHEPYAQLFFPDDLHVPAGEYILDLGAHHGTYAITALMRLAGARIISVEPDPVGVKLLRMHLALNGLEARAEVHDCGVGAAETEALLEQSDEGSWGNKVTTAPADTPVVPIRLRRLESILQGRRPYLVKSNCEGGEFFAIPQLFALGLRPQFIILLIHADAGDAPGLVRSVKEAGYSLTPVQSSESQPRYVCRFVGTNR